MKAFAAGALSILLASGAGADTYKGLTLGDPVPEHMTPLSSQLFAAGLAAQDLPEPFASLCKHEFFVLGHGVIWAKSTGCDGPVIMVSAFEPLRVFHSPADALAPRLVSDIDGITFIETNLGDVADKFGSAGLIGGPYGQMQGSPIGIYSLAYGVGETGTVAVFSFQTPIEIGLLSTQTPPTDPQDRVTAPIIAIDLLSADYFALTLEGANVTRDSGYVPLPADLFAD